MDFTLFQEPKHSKLKDAFSALEEKIAFQEKHIIITEANYQKDCQVKKEAMDKELSEAVDMVKKNYDEAFENATGTDHERHQIAEYESGRENMYEYFENQHEMLEDELNEILDHFNKSSLIMFYALVESEIKRLCFLLQEEMGKRISVEDFKITNYINGYFKYLNLVIELPTERLETYRSKLEPVQLVRNKLAHAGSEISEDLEETKDIRKTVADSKGLLKIEKDIYTDINSLRIYDTAYIQNGFAVFKQLVRELFLMIDEKLDHKLLKEDLQIFFQRHCKSVEFSDIVISKIKKGIGVNISVSLIDDNNQSKKFKMSIQTTRAEKMDFEILNQNEDLNKLTDELKKKKYFHSVQLNRLSGSGNTNHKKIKIY